MYQAYFTINKKQEARPTRDPDKNKSQNQKNNQIIIHSIQCFEPSGADVYFTQIMLSLQFIEIAAKAVQLYHEYPNKK